MPGIVDDLVAPEVAWMIGDHLIVQQHGDAFGMGAHQHHPAGRPRIDAIAIMIGHNQASRAGPDRLLDKPVEGPSQLHQARAFFLEHVPDRSFLELRMLGALGVGDALIFQPCIQFGEALYPRLGPEHLIAQIADLVLDLTLLPSRGGGAGHRFDQMVRAHLQKAEIIPACLADEDRFDHRLHVVVDAAPADPAIEPERLVVGVEYQLLSLPKVDAHKRHAAVRQLHVRRLDRQRQVLERDRLVAPVELVGFPRREAHRHIGMDLNPGTLVAPSLDEPMHAVVGAVISAPAQFPKACPPASTARPPSAVDRKRISISMRASISPPRIDCQGPRLTETRPSAAAGAPPSAPKATARAPDEGTVAARATGCKSARSTLSRAMALLGSRPTMWATVLSPPGNVTRMSPSSARPSSEVTISPARQTKPDACMRWELTETRLGAKRATTPSSAAETSCNCMLTGTPPKYVR